MLYDCSLGLLDETMEAHKEIQRKAEEYRVFLEEAYAVLEKAPEQSIVKVLKTAKGTIYSFYSLGYGSKEIGFEEMLEQMQQAGDTRILYVTVLESKWSFSVLSADCRDKLRALHPDNVHAENISLRLGSAPAF
jgi:hypothetical protein